MGQGEPADISGAARHGHGRKRVLAILRWGLCLVAIIYLVNKVPWHDRVRLSDGSEARLVQERGDGTYVVDINGQSETINESRIARVADGELLDIEYGISTVVKRTRLDLALLAILIFAPVPFFSALRLVWMLRVQGVRLPYWEAAKLTFAGNFFNFALPGTTGGDIYKAYHIARFAHRKTEAVTTVFLDRVIGLLSLVFMAAVMLALVYRPDRLGTESAILGTVMLGLACGIVIVFSKRLRSALRLTQIAERLPAGAHVLRIGRAIVAMREHKPLVLGSLALALTLQIIVVISAIVMARALGMGGEWGSYFIYVSIGFLIAAVPISPPQAFGVMEWAYIKFFAHTGMSTVSQAVALALAVRVIQLVWALPGVLVPIFGAHPPTRAEIEAMEQSESDETDGGAAGKHDLTPEPSPMSV